MRNITYNYKHPHTVWEDIKSDIENDIVNNVYKTGCKVPSITQISQKYEVSNNTAVKVLESLRNDAIILKRRGVGYFVMPYAKDKLLKKKKQEFKTKINHLVLVARSIGYTKEDLVNDIKSEIEKVDW